MSDKGEILRVNTTTAIRGGPIRGFLVVIVVSYIQWKKGLPTRKKTLRNPCIDSTSCGFDLEFLVKVIHLHVSLSRDEYQTT